MDIATLVTVIVSAAAGWPLFASLHLTDAQTSTLAAALTGALTAVVHAIETRWKGQKLSGVTPAKAATNGVSTVAKVVFPFLLIFSLCSALIGCANFPTPQTFNEKLAVGYGTATVVLTTDDTLLQAGKISSATAINIRNQDANLKAALDIAAQVNASNATDGGNQLTAALTALNALTTYLATLK